MAKATPFFDDCVAAFRNGSYPPFDQVSLKVNIGYRASLVGAELKVMLDNGEVATEETNDTEKAITLLQLFTDHQGQNPQEPII